MPISTSPSHNWTRRWARPGLASLLAAVGTACARPQPVTPGTAPELRIGLVAGAPGVTLGGDGELFVSDDSNGEPLGSIPAGTTWTVVVDTPGLRLVKPDGSKGQQRPGVSAVNVTEGRFAMANGRRYRGRVSVIRDPAGLTLMNRVPVEAYLAGVIGGEMGPRRPGERQALLGQAGLSRTLPTVVNAGGGGLQRITDVAVTGTTASGRVGELRIAFEHGDVRVPGSDVRAVLRPRADQLLGSAAFQLSVTKDGGQVTRVIAAGAGWGHGVGLCQWGAVGRARAGQDYRTILTTYFPGTHVERLY